MAIIVSMIIMTVIEDAGVGVATGDPDCAPPEAESLRRRAAEGKITVQITAAGSIL